MLPGDSQWNECGACAPVLTMRCPSVRACVCRECVRARRRRATCRVLAGCGGARRPEAGLTAVRGNRCGAPDLRWWAGVWVGVGPIGWEGQGQACWRPGRERRGQRCSAPGRQAAPKTFYISSPQPLSICIYIYRIAPVEVQLEHGEQTHLREWVRDDG